MSRLPVLRPGDRNSEEPRRSATFEEAAGHIITEAGFLERMAFLLLADEIGCEAEVARALLEGLNFQHLLDRFLAVTEVTRTETQRVVVREWVRRARAAYALRSALAHSVWMEDGEDSNITHGVSARVKPGSGKRVTRTLVLSLADMDLIGDQLSWLAANFVICHKRMTEMEGQLGLEAFQGAPREYQPPGQEAQ